MARQNLPNAEQPARRPGRWIKRLLFVAMLVISCEVALQLFYWVTNGAFLFERAALPIFVADEYRGWSVEPNLDYTHTTNEFSVRLHTNSQGFRGPEGQGTFPIDKQASSYRVMLLGPSFAFGWAADFKDSFAGQLEAMLEASGFADGRDVEILNAGVPSLPPANNLNWYKNVGRHYKPDLLIQLVHGSMAVYRHPSDAYTANDDGYLVPTHASRATTLRHTAKQFGLVFYGWSLYAQLKGQLGASARADQPRPPPKGSIQGAVVADVFDLDEPMVTEAIGFYQDLKAAAVRDGSRLLVVYFPPAYNVHREDVNRWIHDGVWDIGRQLAFNRSFCRHLDERGIRCLNIDQPLIDEARLTGKRLYYWLDTHWTPLGNRVSARAVADYMLAEQPGLVVP